MSLPKIQHRVKNVSLLTQPEDVWIRPYLVKEQKILQTIADSQDINEIYQNIKLLVRSCIVTPPASFNLDDLTIFDVIWIMLQLRALSVKDEVEQIYICNNTPNPEKPVKCGQEIKITYKISDIHFKAVPPKYPDNIIPLENGLKVKMSWPKNILPSDEKLNDLDVVLNMIADDVVHIQDGETVYDNLKREEVLEFLKDLSLNDLEALLDFYSDENLPTLSHTVNYTCPACGYQGQIVLKSISDFF